ncbi:unnamed protein product [Rodentolepis nana]|uniref:Fucosyltransferase n=1 Tax=Rodentolepis nana TaxID=102285 RepID=A0A0R3TSS4_RODNA|nr:unnamed protein product [Rodentolepis nana]
MLIVVTFDMMTISSSLTANDSQALFIMLKNRKTAILIFLAGLVLIVIIISKKLTFEYSNFTAAFIQEYRDDLFPYHHAVGQLQWLTEYSNKSDDLSVGRTPSIYYDRKIIYHVTSPDGCRYKCNFPRNLGNLRKGDAAVFSTHFPVKKANILKARGVIIVFESGESPIFMPHLSSEELNQVDIFVTYMSTSPVPWIYPMFVRNTYPTLKFTKEHVSQMISENNTQLLPPYHKNRTKLVAWVVSNSHPSNNRIQYADALAQFVPIDIYGRNRKLTLPDMENPFEWLSRNYKFYLSFENSNCRQYITEKVQRNALSNGMVPIVLGAYKEDYENVLPPHSYINVDDFDSIQELAEYLQFLDKNDTAYAQYFAWTKHGRIIVNSDSDKMFI